MANAQYVHRCPKAPECPFWALSVISPALDQIFPLYSFVQIFLLPPVYITPSVRLSFSPPPPFRCPPIPSKTFAALLRSKIVRSSVLQLRCEVQLYDQHLPSAQARRTSPIAHHTRATPDLIAMLPGGWILYLYSLPITG
jgi:hypothetical protein